MASLGCGTTPGMMIIAAAGIAAIDAANPNTNALISLCIPILPALSKTATPRERRL
jgi:hypothetical protein